MNICFCGAATFAGLGRCAEHVDRRTLLAEVIRLGALLSTVRTAAPERPRHEHHHAAPANRSETTILERM
jgi:hypothetical protein